MKVTVGIPTKDRYDTLVLTLLGVALQTHQEMHVIIVDDTENPVDLRTLPQYQSVFTLFNERQITFQVIYGRKKGQHYSHQLIQEVADTDWIWRIDDDEIPEANVLSTLCHDTRLNDIGAVGGLVIIPGAGARPENAANKITDLTLPNLQWFKHGLSTVIEVDHLTSSFLYRRGQEKFNLFLSPAAHREETLFTYGLKRKGFKILVDTSCVTWHLRSGTGGIRAHQNHPEYWEQDEKIFNEKLGEWGVTSEPVKTIVLDSGRGDHVLVKSLLPRLKKKYGRVVAATCYRDIFNGEVEQISVAEACNRFGNLDRFNVYRWAIENNWKGSLLGAYEAMWEL